MRCENGGFERTHRIRAELSKKSLTEYEKYLKEVKGKQGERLKSFYVDLPVVKTERKLETAAHQLGSPTTEVDVFVHGFFDVNLERVWMVVQRDLPVLKQKVSKILEEIEWLRSFNSNLRAPFSAVVVQRRLC